MAVVFYIHNKRYEREKKVGLIRDDHLNDLVRLSTRKGLRCFTGIDFVGDTILNNKQLKELKREIIYLQNNVDINEEHLGIVFRAVNEALEDESKYLLVNGE